MNNLWQDQMINFILEFFKTISNVRMGKYQLAGKFTKKNESLS